MVERRSQTKQERQGPGNNTMKAPVVEAERRALAPTGDREGLQLLVRQLLSWEFIPEK